MKKRLSFFTIFLAFCCAMATFSACDDLPKDILEYYSSLEFGYLQGKFSDEDIAMIANYHNSGINFWEDLSTIDALIIQETAAGKAHDRDGHPEAKPEDFEILNYYGEVNGYLVYIIKDPYLNVSEEPVEEWVELGSTKILYTSPYRISFMVDKSQW